MTIFDKRKLYFLGICGTGMGNAAIFFKQKGYSIMGSDNAVYPPMSDFLHSHGIEVLMPYDASNISNNRDSLFVIGNAISRGNAELEKVLSDRLPYTSFPELLKAVHIFDKKSIVIAGTHGKTTLSSLISYILFKAGLDPDFIIGGIPEDFNTGARLGKGGYIVLEGDEYDTSFFDKRPKFVHYAPSVLILTSIELDHTDIYPDISRVEYAFHQVVRTIPRNGYLIACGDYPSVQKVIEHYPWLNIETYGIRPHNNHTVKLKNGIVIDDRIHLDSRLKGIHNALNCTAAYLLARHIGIEESVARDAISSFGGVKRRLELFYENDKTLFFDDFGHHPTAIQKTVEALRYSYPGKSVMAVFEPKTNTTRTNVFIEQYKNAFLSVDSLIIFDNRELKKVKDPLDLIDIKKFLNSSNIECRIETDTVSILQKLAGYDIVVLFSSGSMGGLKGMIQQNCKDS